MSDVIKRVALVVDNAPPQELLLDDTSEICLSLKTTRTNELCVSITRRYSRNQRIIFVKPEQKEFEL